MAKIVTLTTDWNNSDYYIGAVKAAIISGCPDAVFVDISHNIEHFNWQQAAFVLGSVVDDFPAGTIHIIGVDSEPEGDMKVIVAKYKKQYFVCTDNGKSQYPIYCEAATEDELVDGLSDQCYDWERFTDRRVNIHFETEQEEYKDVIERIEVERPTWDL